MEKKDHNIPKVLNYQIHKTSKFQGIPKDLNFPSYKCLKSSQFLKVAKFLNFKVLYFRCVNYSNLRF